MKTKQNTLYVGSLAKGLRLLRAFDEGHTELSLAELAQRTGLDKSATQRLKKGDEGYGVAGRRMLSGCVVAQGECSCVVTETGMETEIGKAMHLVAEAQGGPKAMGLFESKILAIIKLLILATLGFTAVVFVVQLVVRREPFDRVLLVSLSLVIGAVPIALPLVLVRSQGRSHMLLLFCLYLNLSRFWDVINK